MSEGFVCDFFLFLSFERIFSFFFGYSIDFPCLVWVGGVGCLCICVCERVFIYECYQYSVSVCKVWVSFCSIFYWVTIAHNTQFYIISYLIATIFHNSSIFVYLYHEKLCYNFIPFYAFLFQFCLLACVCVWHISLGINFKHFYALFVSLNHRIAFA